LDRDTEDELTMLFVDMYEKEVDTERHLEVKHCISSKDLVLHEQPVTFFSSLFTLLHERITVMIGHDQIEFRSRYEINSNKVWLLCKADKCYIHV
jgi:hypothetical protein